MIAEAVIIIFMFIIWMIIFVDCDYD